MFTVVTRQFIVVLLVVSMDLYEHGRWNFHGRSESRKCNGTIIVVVNVLLKFGSCNIDMSLLVGRQSYRLLMHLVLYHLLLRTPCDSLPWIYSQSPLRTITLV